MNEKMPKWQQEMQKATMEIGFLYCLNSKDLLPFLTATLCGQFAIAGLSENKVKETLDRVFDSYKKMMLLPSHQRNDNWNEILNNLSAFWTDFYLLLWILIGGILNIFSQVSIIPCQFFCRETTIEHKINIIQRISQVQIKLAIV